VTTRRARRHSEARRKMRRRMEARGIPPHQIERRLARVRAEQEAARRADVGRGDLDAIHDETWRQPDDAGYRPNFGDSLERGAARVSSRTARAARRHKATTKYELERRDSPPEAPTPGPHQEASP
jgi:hypothetical protein